MTQRRRGKGEGSVFRRADGRWVGTLDLGYVNGRRLRRAFYGKTRAEAFAKLREAQRSVEQGQDLSASPRTVAQWLSEWLIMKKSNGTAPSTLRSYGWLVRSHLVPTIGATRIDKLTPSAVQKVLAAKLDSGLSARTVQQMRAVLSASLADAERYGYVLRNVAAVVRGPRVERTVPQHLDADEARRLIDVLKGDRLAALYSTLLLLGLRRGEGLALKWEDFDFEARTVRVQRSLQRTDEGLVFRAPKSSTSNRTLPAPKGLLHLLTEHCARQQIERIEAGACWQETGLVFTTANGTPLEPRNVNRRWAKVRAKAGLDGLRLHDLRHSYATLLLSQNVSPRVIRELLGHSQIGITMNTYAHVIPDLLTEASSTLEASIFG